MCFSPTTVDRVVAGAWMYKVCKTLVDCNPLTLLPRFVLDLLYNDQGRPQDFFPGGHRRRKGSVVGGHHGECGARAYNGGLGAEPPAGSRGRAPSQGVRGLRWKHFGHWMSNGAGKFSPFPKMHLYFYSMCNGNDMGKFFCRNPGGGSGDPPLPLPGGAHDNHCRNIS